jgi:hypothetical protein
MTAANTKRILLTDAAAKREPFAEGKPRIVRDTKVAGLHSVGRGEDQYQPDLSIEGPVQGASRTRSAQDHRLDGAHDLGDCRYGAAPR